MTKINPMQTVKLDKVVLNIGAKGAVLEKAVKLLGILTNGRKAARMKTTKRIPAFEVRPGLEVGAVVTVRKGKEELLKKLLIAVDKIVRRKQATVNSISFGLKEYLDIPGVEYNRDIGMMGLDVTAVFKRSGRRVRLRKIKRAKVPPRQDVQKQEIIKFMEENFQVKFV